MASGSQAGIGDGRPTARDRHSQVRGSGRSREEPPQGKLGQPVKGELGRGVDTNLAAGTGAEPGCRAEPDWIPGGPGRGVKGRRRQAAQDWLSG